jgi:NAD(P)-dependent dehydrogenase (short-subunit alcohol dehydrogenase family)
MPSILITGVSTGIGRACAERFALAGWTVVGTVRDIAAAETSAQGGVALVQLDLSDPESPARCAASVIQNYGCPDVVLNNAGLLQFGPVEEMGIDEMEHLFRVNVFGQIALTAAFLPAMREHGSGTIANVTSLGGRTVFPFFAGYNATKWALEGFSEGLWHELKPFGIRVKAIEPGYVDTAIWGKVLPDDDEAITGSEPYLPFLRAMRVFEASITDRTSPEDCAEEIWRAVIDPSDRLRYPVAAYARPIIAARRWLGDQASMRFFHKRWFAGGGK